jgi:hypothetical protein
MRTLFVGCDSRPFGAILLTAKFFAPRQNLLVAAASRVAFSAAYFWFSDREDAKSAKKKAPAFPVVAFFASVR